MIRLLAALRRTKPLATIWVLTACVAGTASIAQAQGSDAASIIGRVIDESGGVLPGVTVSAKSSALQVAEVTSITDANGEYRLTPLPIGTYTATYTLEGFQTVRREEVRLTVGFVARLDVTMAVGSMQEAITVIGGAPLVDVTSASTNTAFTRETLEATPTSRNGIVGLLAQAPGVRGNLDVGGTSTAQVPTTSSFGQPGDPWASLEGVITTALQATGGNANYWDYTAIEEARVQTVGNDAEIPARGVAINAVVKSGGNTFHGSAWAGVMTHGLQGSNITDALRAQGITSGNRIDHRYDTSADIGGRIVPDRLWFYQAFRRRGEVSPVFNAFKPDGSAAENIQLSWFSTDKISYQATKAQRVVLFYQYNHKHDVAGVTQFVPWESRSDLTTLSHTGKIGWQAVRGNAVFEAQYGHWGYDAAYANNAPGKVATIDLVTLSQTGPSTVAGQRPYENRGDARASLSYYKPGLFLGNHNFKVGGGYMANDYARVYSDNEDTQAFNYQLIYRSGVPFELSAYNYFTEPKAVVDYTSVYFKDAWTINRRLTLDVGLRYAHDNGFVPASCRNAARAPGDVAFPAACFEKQQFNIWNSTVPRVHVALDVTGDGKTVVKAGWGRFAHMRQLDPELTLADPNVASAAVYLWHDLNGNSTYESGEVNLDPNGPDFVSQTTTAASVVSTATRPSGGVPSSSERQPMTDEWSGSLEREWPGQIALRVSGVFSKNVHIYRQANLRQQYGAYNVPITRPDPGPDGRSGTGDDPGTSITFYEFEPTLAGQRFQLSTWINDESASQTYKSIELSLLKRMSHRWQFAASYTASKIHVPYINGLTLDQGASPVVAGPFNPNAEINSTADYWESTGKASAAIQLPYGVTSSANFEHRSGLAWARQVLFTGGQTIPSVVLNVEPIGTRRLASINLLDARLEKAFKVGGDRRVSVRMNVFNLANVGTVTALTMRSGATFLRPTAILPPRVVELSASLQF